uniref:Uncharacterized protein n=1 Tax=Mycena chlorophos TaxID=658473 RepID=A0ABQ0M7F9_MYCCL|nr:predicted protein [Mycena chlorophos]
MAAVNRSISLPNHHLLPPIFTLAVVSAPETPRRRRHPLRMPPEARLRPFSALNVLPRRLSMNVHARNPRTFSENLAAAFCVSSSCGLLRPEQAPLSPRVVAPLILFHQPRRLLGLNPRHLASLETSGFARAGIEFPSLPAWQSVARVVSLTKLDLHRAPRWWCPGLRWAFHSGAVSGATLASAISVSALTASPKQTLTARPGAY